MKQITFEQYRTLDMTIFTIVLLVFETITTIATNTWFAAQPVAISISLALICVVMMRWGARAGILAVAGGFAFCLASHATMEQYLIYCIGNLFALSALLLFKRYKKETIRKSVPKLSLFVLIAYLGMAFGRFLISLFFGGEWMTLVVYLTTDIISLLFAEVVLLLLRNTDGMIEDQKAYLLRVEREKQEEQNRPQDDEYFE